MKTILVYLLAVFLVTDCLSQSHLKKSITIFLIIITLSYLLIR